MGTAAYGGNGKGSGQWREANRGRQLQTATQAVVMPVPPPAFGLLPREMGLHKCARAGAPPPPRPPHVRSG